jgi:hypothetical protein
MAKKKIKYHEFPMCEAEGCSEKGIHMWFAKKVLCSKHADEEFKKYLKALLASLAAGGMIVIALFIF